MRRNHGNDGISGILNNKKPRKILVLGVFGTWSADVHEGAKLGKYVSKKYLTAIISVLVSS